MSQNPFHEFLQNIKKEPLRVLDPKFVKSDYVPLDLSTHNKDLQSIDTSSSEELADFIFDDIKSQNGKVGFGGYNEKRHIYKRSYNFNSEDEEEDRNIHIGIDLWLEEGADIFSPLDGKIHSYKNNTEIGDYGPTIILEHKMGEFIFYTLYGHLSHESMEHILGREKIKEGDKIATLGDSSVNGDYPPHLHFQIIRDLEGMEGDYPGVCSSKNLDFYLENCPDPNLILKL